MSSNLSPVTLINSALATHLDHGTEFFLNPLATIEDMALDNLDITLFSTRQFGKNTTEPLNRVFAAQGASPNLSNDTLRRRLGLTRNHQISAAKLPDDGIPLIPQSRRGSVSVSTEPFATDNALDFNGLDFAQPTALASNETSFFFSLQSAVTVAGSTYQDEDIIAYDGPSQSFSPYFDGSDVGLGALEIDAFDIINETEILLSFTAPATIGGMVIDDSDIVRFTATQLGNTTAGSFALFFDASDVGLTTNGEDLDGVQRLDDGSFLISTVGPAVVPGLTQVNDEDILRFVPTSLGSNTRGFWSVYVDGSDIGLATTHGEDVDAIALDEAGSLNLSTRGSFAVSGVAGTDEDVFRFTPLTTGANTQGTFSPELFFEGGAQGIVGDIRGLDLAIGVNHPDPGNPPPPNPPQFNIELNFTDNNLSQSQRAIFTNAANRWSEIIVGDIADIFVTGIGLIDDVLIDISAPTIDGAGGILGQAGPTRIRSGSFLPATGIIELDRADINNLQTNGGLDDVILHEIGHIVGIGTTWGLQDLLTGAGSSNPRFIGVNATAEYNSIFGLDASSVPVANTGGPGTRDAHWRESVFGNELLTGFLNAGANPLSRITAASLVDLGYEVNLDAADPYSPPAQLFAGEPLGTTSSGVVSSGVSSFHGEPLLASQGELTPVSIEPIFV